MSAPKSIIYTPVVMSYYDRRQFWLGVFSSEHETALRNLGTVKARHESPAQTAIEAADAALKAYVDRFEKGEDVTLL